MTKVATAAVAGITRDLRETLALAAGWDLVVDHLSDCRFRCRVYNSTDPLALTGCGGDYHETEFTLSDTLGAIRDRLFDGQPMAEFSVYDLRG